MSGLPPRPPRGKTSSGLTSLERRKHLESLDGSTAFIQERSENTEGHECEHCASRRSKIKAMQQEFQQLRELLITKKSVLEIPDSAQTEKDAASPEELALIQESAKLRITIDTLMRFQVCISNIRS